MTSSTLKNRVAVLEADMAVMKEQLERSQALVGIEKGIRAMKQGDGIPAKAAVAMLRKKFRLPPR